MFIDRVTIQIKAGNGGDGCVSFRREKYVPRGGPDGGMGGKGGDVIVKVDREMRTLLDLYYRKSVKAQSGKHGQGKNMTGANGEDEYIMVPPGTVVEDADTKEILADLDEPGAESSSRAADRGGKGNYLFRTPKIQAPRTRTHGRSRGGAAARSHDEAHRRRRARRAPERGQVDAPQKRERRASRSSLRIRSRRSSRCSAW